MLLLPSGQTIVRSTWRLTMLLRATDRPDRDAIVLALAHPRDLLPWCDLFRRHDDLDAAPARLIPARQLANPPRMPKGTVDEPLGVTGANWREYAGGWSEEDAAAVAAWLADDVLGQLFAAEWQSVVRLQAAIRRRQAEGTPPPPPPPPPPSPEESERLAALEARVRAAAERRAQAPPPPPPPLPFDWHDFPVDDFGGARLRHAADRRLDIGGRSMWIHLLHQFGTYAGLLCGSPRDPERHLRAALETARQVLQPPAGVEPLLLPPRLRTGSDYLMRWTALPPVTSVARCCDGGNLAYLIWFQDDFGLPDDPALRAALAAIGPGPWYAEWSP